MTREQAIEWAATFVADSKIEEAVIASVRHVHCDITCIGEAQVQLDIDPSIFRAHLARWKKDE